jgi:gamma-glutamylputrescine oxidase
VEVIAVCRQQFFLAQQGVETVLIEKYYCGYGASGRNAGHLTPTIGKDIPSLLMVYGKKRAQELIHFAEQSVSFYGINYSK